MIAFHYLEELLLGVGEGAGVLTMTGYWYWYIYWSRVDKQHMKFVESLPRNASQSSHSAEPMGRGYMEGSHTVASSSVG